MHIILLGRLGRIDPRRVGVDNLDPTTRTWSSLVFRRLFRTLQGGNRLIICPINSNIDDQRAGLESLIDCRMIPLLMVYSTIPHRIKSNPPT